MWPAAAEIVVKLAQVLSRPNAPWSCAPVTVVEPALPITTADTIRGDTPRWVTRIPTSLPLTSFPSRLPAPVTGELASPVVVGVTAGAVVRIVDAAQPRSGARPGPGVLDVLGVAARAGEEVGGGRRAVVGDDLAGGRGDRGVGGGRLRRHAAVHLRAGVGIQVVEGAGHVGGDRVRARGHGLRLQRLRRPGRGHLGRDHAPDVVVESDHVDRVHAPVPLGRNSSAPRYAPRPATLRGPGPVAVSGALNLPSCLWVLWLTSES